MPSFDLNQRLKNALPPTPPGFSQAVQRGLAMAAQQPQLSVRKRPRYGMWAAVAACCILAIGFGGIWSANPAMADGISFRQGIISFFNGDRKAVQELVQPPIATGQGTHGKLPEAEIGVYKVTLSETVFDGNNLYLGYTLRMKDGSALPDQSKMFDVESPPEGEVRVEGLRIDGTDDFFSAPMRSSAMYVDPFETHTSLEVELDGLLTEHELTDQSKLELLLSNNAYKVTPDKQGESQIESVLLEEATLAFRVSTANRGVAHTLVPLQTTFDMDGWTLVIQRIEVSPLVTRLHYRATGPAVLRDVIMGGMGGDRSVFLNYVLQDDKGNTYNCSSSSSGGSENNGQIVREGSLDFESFEGPATTLTLSFETFDTTKEELVKIDDLYPPIQIQLPANTGQ